MKDEFLSEEDLDLVNLSEAELFAYWDLWLHQAQASNDLDAHLYSHGVFLEEPGPEVDAPAADGAACDQSGVRSQDQGRGPRPGR